MCLTHFGRCEYPLSVCAVVMVPPLRRVTFLSGKVTKTICSWFGPPSSGSLTPATLRGHAPNGHPCPDGAWRASLPAIPLRAACVRPAPKSRLVVSGLAWMKIKSEARAALDRSHAPRGNAALDAPRPMTRSVMRSATTRSDQRSARRARAVCCWRAEISQTTQIATLGGRAQVLRSRAHDMDVVRAPPGHGCPFGAYRRSNAGAREPRRRRGRTRERDLLVTFAAFGKSDPP